MTFSRLEAALEDAFVEWINTFDRISHPIDTIVELADGIVLSEVLADIDDKWFKPISVSDSDSQNWVMRFNHHKKLHKLVMRYFEEILGQDPELLPTINLNAIAKDADLHDLILECQLVIAIAVQSDNNRAYIEKIQELTPKSQHALMVSIEEVMNFFNGDAPTNDKHGHVRYSDVSGTGKTISSCFQEEHDLDKLRHMEIVHTRLKAEYNSLRDRYEDILSEKQDLQTRLRDMDEAITQANSTGKADNLMRTEIDHLKQDLEKSEDKRQETESMLENYMASVDDLKKKVDELSSKAEEASSLRDQLEEYKQGIEKMHKLETVLEKYKRKADEASDLRRQIKALEEQNTNLLERSHQVEDEYRKVLSFKTLMDSYKGQVQQLEQGHMELGKEKQRLESQIQQMSETCTFLEGERDRNVEQVQLLEERIKELEHNAETNINDEIVSHRASVTIEEDEVDVGGSVEENMKKSNITELRLTIGRLKRRVQELEEQKSTQPEDTNNIDQKNYTQLVEERDQLRQDLIQIRNGIPDSLLNQTQTVMALRARVFDLKKDASQIKAATAKLELTVDTGVRSVAKDHSSLDQYEQDHARIQDRLNRLEDITKMHLHDINRMLIEANYLNGLGHSLESGKPDLSNTTKRPDLSDHDLEVIKEQNADLQIHVLHLQEEINETQSRIRKVRDLIKLYKQLLHEMAVRFNHGRAPDKSAALLTRVPRTKEEEQDLLKKQIHDVRLQSRREQQLIVSAWYDLARCSHRSLTNLTIRSTPSSWLGRQRKVLDSQLRQRLC